jgi:LPXTG-motif cell wall-anchored protein
VRHPVRKFVGVALIGVLAVFAMPMLAAGAANNSDDAGSGGVDPPSPGLCINFNATAPNGIPGDVVGSVDVPAGANLVIITFTPTGGVPETHEFDVPSPAGGTIGFTFPITTTGVVTANYLYGNQNAYATGCTGPGGILAIEISRPVPAAAPAAAAKLAFTGSSDTPTYVLIGVAALVFGLVLVVAARRRSQVS